MITKNEALNYHEITPKGKIEIIATKPCATQKDLSLAYTPGVAEPCLEIEKDSDNSYRFTARGNLVGVITNGTAVLGLGNIGPYAAKPVMEGKAVLFKKFANIDAFDLEIKESDPDRFVEIVKSLEPTFGGINLEDIKAPECFYIERRLTMELNIPVFHDDQHGTAVISGAALLNSLEITGRNTKNVKIVFSGAGAAAIACAKIFHRLGVPRENIFLCDRKGLVHQDRDDIEPERGFFAQKTPGRTLADAMRDADVFVGVSSKGLVTPTMLKSMAPNAIVFALANPDPEITYPEAIQARPDIIMATGRSDYPNQVNNVLGFPAIFRGALDVGASTINEEMKIAASLALAKLAKEPIPAKVYTLYQLKEISFGKNYIIPKALDYRVVPWVAPEVARAAMNSGVAKRPIADLAKYRQELEALIAKD
ncbi:MAG: malate dehydrogenase [Deltaproteobacteria bacterium]|nr:malate dehydrogenase [Deltaproteobacteria bacterium]